MVTIDKAIKTLQKAKRLIGGDKGLTVSLTASGLEEKDVSSIYVVDDNESKYVQLRVAGFEGIDQHIMWEELGKRNRRRRK